MPSIRPDFVDASGREIDIADAVLKQAEKEGAVVLERHKRTPHLIERVRLLDPARLAEFLDRKPAAIKANAILDMIAPHLAGAADWIQEVIGRGLDRWNRGDQAFRLHADRVDRILEFTKILLAIDHGVDGRDLRTFSIEAGVDSKAFERHRGTIVAIVRDAYELNGFNEDEVLATIGFRAFHQAIYVRGPLAVAGMGLDCRGVRPYLGLPPAAAADINLVGSIRAVLTVENFASFNRQTAEVDDDDVVVVYSGGFPSPPIVTALRVLRAQSPMATFKHWGDIDAGGVRIFRNLEERVGVTFTPHLMDAELAEARGRKAAAIPSLARIAETGSGIAGLARYLSRGDPRHLEQEAVSPVSMFGS